MAHALTVGPSSIIACVLLWEHLGQLGVYLLLAHGTRRQSHHKVVSRPTPKSNDGISNGASFDTAVTIKWRFALLNVKCFSDFSLPLPACTISCLHALPIDFIWHRLFMDTLGNGWLGALSKSNRIAMFLLSYTQRTPSFAYIFTRARFAFHRVHGAGNRICWKSVLRCIKRAQGVWCVKCAPDASRALQKAGGSSGETSRKTMLVTVELGYPIWWLPIVDL